MNRHHKRSVVVDGLYAAAAFLAAVLFAVIRRLAWRMGTALMLSSTKSAAVKTEVNGWPDLDASSLDMLFTAIASHVCAPVCTHHSSVIAVSTC